MSGDEAKRRTFRRMQVVLSGDFFQLPPISREGGETEFIHKSDSWKKMDARVCYLDEQFRHSDSSLEKILNEMRSGSVSSTTRGVLEKATKRPCG